MYTEDNTSKMNHKKKVPIPFEQVPLLSTDIVL